MAQFLLIIQIVSQLIPLAIQIIASVEAAFPQGGNGQVKLEMVRGVLQAGFEGMKTTQTTFDAVWPALNSVITGIVKLTTK